MLHPPSFDDGRPPFDEALARELLGRYVLVGITYLDAGGEVTNQIQFHGIVESGDAHRGFKMRLCGELDGEERWLPPDTESFQRARRGDYRLRSTGEIVSDPDFVCSWTVTARSDA